MASYLWWTSPSADQWHAVLLALLARRRRRRSDQLAPTKASALLAGRSLTAHRQYIRRADTSHVACTADNRLLCARATCPGVCARAYVCLPHLLLPFASSSSSSSSSSLSVLSWEEVQDGETARGERCRQRERCKDRLMRTTITNNNNNNNNNNNTQYFRQTTCKGAATSSICVSD